MTQKTTDEIRELLSNADLDFESVENKALNNYLPKIFHSCPFTDEICTTKQCTECEVFMNSANKQNFDVKVQKANYYFEQQ
jgi:hypothetical protein